MKPLVFLAILLLGLIFWIGKKGLECVEHQDILGILIYCTSFIASTFGLIVIAWNSDPNNKGQN